MAQSTKQPKEMYLLSLIEMSQRFAFWSIGSLLVIYLVKAYKMSDASATHLYGLFTGVAFILPLAGGYIADRFSYRWSVIIGSASTALGCFLMAAGTLHLVYAALFFTAIGASIFTPSIYAILGSLYKDRHHLREGGFSIYYSSVNVGVFLAVFIIGSLGHLNAWGLAFSIAGIVQLAGLGLFLKIHKSPEFANLHVKTASQIPKSKAVLNKKEKSRIAVIIALSLTSILFWIAYNQAYSSMSLFALRYTDREVFGSDMPVSWLLSLESLYLILLAFPLAWLYTWLRKQKLDPSPPMKTVFGLIAMGLCFALMMVGSRHIPSGAVTSAVSPLYLVGSFALMAIAEMLLAPIGLALVTHLSPHRFTALLVGVWYICIGIAFYIGGLLAGMMSSMEEMSDFFGIFVLLTLIPAFILLLVAKRLNKMRHAESL